MVRPTVKVRALIITLLMVLIAIPLMLGTESANAQPSPKATATKRVRATPTPDVPQEIDLTGDPQDVITALVDQGILSGNNEGKLLFNWNPNTFTRVSTPGIKSLIVGRSRKAETFVTNVKISWKSIGDNSACGIGFYDVSNNTFGIFILYESGKAAIYQADNGDEVINLAYKTDLFTPGDETDVTLIAETSEMLIYINGQYFMTAEVQPMLGRFTAIIFNPKGNTRTTHCIYSEGWVWSLDG